MESDRDAGIELVVFSNEEKAKKAYEEYLLFGEETYLYPARDLLFYYADIKGKTLTNRRMEVLRAIAEKRKRRAGHCDYDDGCFFGRDHFPG